MNDFRNQSPWGSPPGGGGGNGGFRRGPTPPDIDEVISGKEISGVIDMLDAQLKATHKTGAELTAAYNIPGLDPDKVYRYKLNSQGGLTTQPVYTGFEKSDFKNEDALRQQLYSLYNYDAEDQYFYGTDEGEAYLEQKIRS